MRLVCLLILALAASLSAQPAAAPSGFSSSRVARLRQQIQSDVDSKAIPGLVLVVHRHGKPAIQEAIGFQNRAANAPMKLDSIFRIASMTKPVTTVAAMILAEEGKLDLGASVAKYLPEFRDVKVGPELATPKRPMMVLDLMRHTSGLTYGLFGNSPVDDLYRKSTAFASPTLAAMVTAVAKLPLLHHPGDAWEYSVSSDVLARVVEVSSGMEIDRFFAEHITGPLKMKDTAYYLSPAQAARVAVSDGGMFGGAGGDPTVRPGLLMGGAGLFSTAADYTRFCQMLLNGGELDGVRILSPHSVALMTSDQLPPGIRRHTPVALSLGAFGPTPEMGTSFGLGFAVRVDPGRNPVPGSVGDFSWSGITGTFFWVDPKEKLTAVMMLQGPAAQNNANYRRARTLVYQALVN
ncbi:MAG: beta-lactamase family protein [Bryobacteraceae bacterium]|nr:beta-lactamase family protein [Bryobacteraceae bacterium]